MLEKADEALAGGNTKYTAGAMRFIYDGAEDLLPLLRDQDDPRLKDTVFGAKPGISLPMTCSPSTAGACYRRNSDA